MEEVIVEMLDDRIMQVVQNGPEQRAQFAKTYGVEPEAIAETAVLDQDDADGWVRPSPESRFAKNAYKLRVFEVYDREQA